MKKLLLVILVGLVGLLVLGYVTIKQSRENQRLKKDLIEVEGKLAKLNKGSAALEERYTTLSKKYDYAKGSLMLTGKRHVS